MKCPFCSHQNIPGEDTCDSCGENLASLDGIKPKERHLMHDPLTLLAPKQAAVVTMETNVWEAVKKMNEVRQGCVLVQDKSGEIQGIVTERDILFKTSGDSSELKKMKVTQIMTANVEKLSDDSPLAVALHQMSVKRLRHLPIVKEGEAPRILSARDLLKHISKHL
ncbi:MAG: CBS domain-containing protein [Deltaproteobacteria bacterium]|nr:CBS domain-containing protein [Deltaproteobacteria bacterium]